MRVHIDGARSPTPSPRSAATSPRCGRCTVDAGVDVVTFGGTKNGLLGGEAVVFLDPELAERAEYVRKQITQLPSKMRFVAAQFLALLDDDLWLALRRPRQRAWPGASTRRRARPARRRRSTDRRSTASSRPCRPDAIEPLREWSFFWDWDVGRAARCAG